MAAMNMILYGNLQRRRPRTYRLKDFMHNNTFSDEDIRMRFRFSRQGIVFLTNLLRQDLQRPTQRNHALSVESQVLISLKFLACGSFQQVVGDVIGVDKSTVSRIVPQFCQALNRKRNQFIVFPTTAQQKTEIKQGFYRMAGFPSTIACIDCTHVRISCPHEDEKDFVNRKNYHSINVQALTDHNYRFLDVDARWPGSTHDSFIFRVSAVKNHLDNNNNSIDDGLVIGDSGYALSRYLLTPYDNPVTPRERRFNRCQKRARSSVERSFGLLKARFPALRFGLRVDPIKACQIIGTCFILHNIAIMLNEDPFDDEEDPDDFEAEPYDGDDQNRGAIRDHIANTFF
ncbi:putative nuclease HARBI1 [Clytia hemisphaerica]|uniref:putative nuclease HARBI1 n=1 Tax=Clytia hemisphaerica TaxID=252671 RepID=UPI0034D5AB8D